jgi:hypothetical protein
MNFVSMHCECFTFSALAQSFFLTRLLVGSGAAAELLQLKMV